MTGANDSGKHAQSLLRRRPVQAGLVLLVLAVAAGAAWLVLQPSASTVFAVNATTGAVEMRTLCTDKIVWDLPAGEVQGRSCVPHDPADLTDAAAFRRACSHGPGTVTATLLAGATAKVALDADDGWGVTFGTAKLGCSVQPPEPLVVSVGDETLPFDPEGYFYRPAAAVAASEPTEAVSAQPVAGIALPLKGRVIVGEAMQLGAGWRADVAPILREAQFVARSRALGSGEPMTMMSEDVEAGTIIDTHPEATFGAAFNGERGAADRVLQAEGFVQVGADALGVQLYNVGLLGLVPYASAVRVIRVSRWRPLWASPPFQLLAAAVVVTVSLIARLYSFYQAKLILTGKMPVSMPSPAAAAAGASRSSASANAPPPAALPAPGTAQSSSAAPARSAAQAPPAAQAPSVPIRTDEHAS